MLRTDASGTYWHVAFGALLGGGLAALVEILEGGTAQEVLTEGLKGAAVGAIIAFCPESAVVFATHDTLVSLLDFLYMGYSLEEVLAIMAIQGTVNISVPSTDDETIDMLVDATFGTAQELTQFACVQLVEHRSRETPNPAVVSHGIISAITAGGGSGGRCDAVIVDNLGGTALWIIP